MGAVRSARIRGRNLSEKRARSSLKGQRSGEGGAGKGAGWDGSVWWEGGAGLGVVPKQGHPPQAGSSFWDGKSGWDHPQIGTPFFL